ncbi:MAG TPA: hypothetical protein VGL77_09760 [Armatimonadota bacterium]|jgi:hypothetical protein
MKRLLLISGLAVACFATTIAHAEKGTFAHALQHMRTQKTTCTTHKVKYHWGTRPVRHTATRRCYTTHKSTVFHLTPRGHYYAAKHVIVCKHQAGRHHPMRHHGTYHRQH